MVAATFCMATISCLGWHSNLPPLAGLRAWPLAVLLVLSLGALCDDPWARWFRRIAWPLIPLLGALAACDAVIDYPFAARWTEAIYLACLTAIALTYWYRRPAVPIFVGAMITLATLAGTAARWMYVDLEESRLAEGLPWLAWGSAALLLALILSFAKGGIVARFLRWLRSFGHNAGPFVRPNANNHAP
jgi:hypothetical protein